MSGILPSSRSRTPGRSKNRCCSCQTWWILIIFLLVLTLIGLGLGLGIPALLKMKERPELTIGESVERILQNADQTLDPCTNFYSYACGNYGKKQNKVDVLTDVKKQISQEVEDLLIKPKEHNDPPTYNKVKDFFASCMDIDLRNQYELEPLLKLLNKLGGWPVKEGKEWQDLNGNWINLHSTLYKNGIVPNFIIDVQSITDEFKTDQNILYISPKTYLPPQVFLFGPNIILNAYHQLMIDVARYLGADVETAEKEMTQVFDFENKLAKAMSNREEATIKKTIYELETILPDLDLLGYLHAVLPYKVDGNEQVLTKHTQSLAKISQLLKQTDMRTLTNFVIWRIIVVSLQYLDEKSIAMYNDFHVKIGMKPHKFQAKCVDDTLFFLPSGVSLMYAKTYLNEDIKQTVTNLANEIREIFLMLTYKMRWLDNSTKEIAIEKIKQTEFYIAFPEEYLNDESINELYNDINVQIKMFFQNVMTIKLWEYNRNLWQLKKTRKSLWDIYTNILLVKARNNVQRNSIEIFVNDLQLMYYDSKGPMTFNLGTLGFAIAHELFHSIDKRANKYNENKTVNGWWSLETTLSFVNISECFIKKYNSYTEPLTGLEINGTKTLAENMADFVGVRTAYNAFRKYIENKGGSQRLPSKYPWTEEQLFWLSYANMFCNNGKDSTWQATDNHSPDMFRVNGPLASLPEFVHDFNCNINSEMAAKNQRCKM